MLNLFVVMLCLGGRDLKGTKSNPKVLYIYPYYVCIIDNSISSVQLGY